VRGYIYTSSEVSTNLLNAFYDLVEILDLEVVEKDRPQRGSWFQRVFLRARRTLTSSELKSRLEEIERAIEMRALALDHSQTEIDRVQADAVARLVNSLENVNDAVIQAGAVLLVKVEGRTIVRQLTQSEVLMLQRNPELLQSPASIVEKLIEMRGSPEILGNHPSGQVENRGNEQTRSS
jgi:hypothetical protein